LQYNLAPDLAPSYPLLLSQTISGGEPVWVSDPIPFAFILDSITVWRGPTPGSGAHFQVYISDDASIDASPRPTGEPVFDTTFDGAAGTVPEPRVEFAQPVTLEPGIVVRQAGKRIKVHWRNAATGHTYNVLCELIPIGETF
jgi:hypothetical protein